MRASDPASEAYLKRLEQEPKSSICIVGKYGGDVFEVVVQRSYLSKLNEGQLQVNVDYDPTLPEAAERNVYGISKAKQKARGRWLRRVIRVSSSTHSPEVKQVCYDFTRSKGLQEELDRTLLIDDILVKATLGTFQHTF